MTNLDVIVLNYIKKIFDNIFPWNNNDYYGCGVWIKFIICLFIFQQIFNFAYIRKKGSAKK